MTSDLNPSRTMTVRIRDRASESAWGQGPTSPCVRTVTISATCPRCGGQRGTPRNLNSYDDGVHYSVDIWDNACGHIDAYSDVAQEIRALVDENEEPGRGEGGQPS